MNHSIWLLQIIVTLFIVGCNRKTDAKIVEANIDKIRDSSIVGPSQSLNFKVSAYLIYNDGSISSFDILNDKSVALWNTITGGGNALKPSTKVKLVLLGEADDITVRIKNGKRKVIENSLSHFVGEAERVIENTGCEEIFIDVSRHSKILYSGTIPFHCGE